jgi:hypothetical protein
MEVDHGVGGTQFHQLNPSYYIAHWTEADDRAHVCMKTCGSHLDSKSDRALC